MTGVPLETVLTLNQTFPLEPRTPWYAPGPAGQINLKYSRQIGRRYRRVPGPRPEGTQAGQRQLHSTTRTGGLKWKSDAHQSQRKEWSLAVKGIPQCIPSSRDILHTPHVRGPRVPKLYQQPHEDEMKQPTSGSEGTNAARATCQEYRPRSL